MNEIHSDTELIYKKRWLYPLVRDAINTFPVVVISGARQVGKSTFLEQEFSDFKYINLDDFSHLSQAKTDPASLWKDADHVIIDEAQKAPEIFTHVKTSVDRSRRKRRFILSGSSNLLLLEKVTETLAGRAVYFEMLPMAIGEIEEVEKPENFFTLWQRNIQIKEHKVRYIAPISFLIKGFMPPLLYIEDLKNILLWWEGYIKTYLERDLRELSQIDSLIDFRRVLEAVALRTGTVVNQNEISRDTKISQPTVSRYLKLLEVSNIIERVPSFHSSRTKRIVKSPKVYLIDPALSIYLSGYHDPDALLNSRELGFYFETMIYLHLKILSELMVPKARIFYWRTVTGKEVDFVLEQGRRVIAFEVKFTENPTIKDIQNLLAFLEQTPQAVRGIVLHTGDSVRWLHSKILAVPWWWIGM